MSVLLNLIALNDEGFEVQVEHAPHKTYPSYSAPLSQDPGQIPADLASQSLMPGRIPPRPMQTRSTARPTTRPAPKRSKLVYPAELNRPAEPQRTATVSKDQQNANYNDPAAKIVLRCKEEEVFRVHDYKLKAFSNTFEDMFAIGHPPSHDDRDPEPLDIDVSSADLELFLDFMYKPVTQTLTVDQFEAVLSLCDKFDCRLLGKFVLGHLYTIVKTAPWKTFALAARYDDTELARRALSLMIHDEAHRNTSCANLSLRDAETIPLGYLLPVLHGRS